tara:strand:- start:1391 stop:1594 length:204 start_codon:yes stop_codon:yes gene_type:complete
MISLRRAFEFGQNLRSIDALMDEIVADEEVILMHKSMIFHLEKGNIEKSFYESQILRDFLIDLTTES